PTRPTISKIWKAHENADFQVFFCLSFIQVSRSARAGMTRHPVPLSGQLSAENSKPPQCCPTTNAL
ncbi:hypothetical protein, partial [Pseudomonas amygdali]